MRVIFCLRAVGDMWPRHWAATSDPACRRKGFPSVRRRRKRKSRAKMTRSTQTHMQHTPQYTHGTVKHTGRWDKHPEQNAQINSESRECVCVFEHVHMHVCNRLDDVCIRAVCVCVWERKSFYVPGLWIIITGNGLESFTYHESLWSPIGWCIGQSQHRLSRWDGSSQPLHGSFALLHFFCHFSVSMFSPSGGAAFDSVYHKHLLGRTVNPSVKSLRICVKVSTSV